MDKYIYIISDADNSYWVCGYRKFYNMQMLKTIIKNMIKYPKKYNKLFKLAESEEFKECFKKAMIRTRLDSKKKSVGSTYKDIKIAGLFMCHDATAYAKKAIDYVAKFTNAGIYVNLNDPVPEIEKIVLSHPAITKTIRTTNKKEYWSQMTIREATIRMLDNVKPDIVIFFDDDEEGPNNLGEQLKTFWEDEDKKTFWFNGLYMWEEKDTFRRDGLYKSMWNCRIYKWQPKITYFPKYAGRACPTTFANLPRESKYFSNKPLFHWGYMTEEDRKIKYKRNNSQACDSEFRKERDKTMLIKKLPDELK